MVWQVLFLATLLSYVVMQHPDSGPYCFDCDVMNAPDLCTNASVCDQGQVCMLTEKTTLGLDGHPTYKTNCALPKDCQSSEQVSLFGKKRATRCHMCCKEDFCNNKCHNEQVSISATPLVTSHTTSLSNGTQAIFVPTKHATTTTQNHLTSSVAGSQAIHVPTKPVTTSTRQTTHQTTPHHHVTHTPSTTSPNVTTNKFREFCQLHRYQYDAGSNLCFAPHADLATWAVANHRCNNEHGMLAVVDTPEKWQLLQHIIYKHYRHSVYIGGSEVSTRHSHHYQWTNGASFNFTAWAPGQPDSRHEECVSVNSADHQWHDARCDQHLHFVCTIEPQ